MKYINNSAISTENILLVVIWDERHSDTKLLIFL